MVEKLVEDRKLGPEPSVLSWTYWATKRSIGKKEVGPFGASQRGKEAGGSGVLIPGEWAELGYADKLRIHDIIRTGVPCSRSFLILCTYLGACQSLALCSRHWEEDKGKLEIVLGCRLFIIQELQI